MVQALWLEQVATAQGLGIGCYRDSNLDLANGAENLEVTVMSKLLLLI